MSEEMLVRLCAPTLAAIKTGSLFSCAFDSREAMLDTLTKMNQALTRKGVRAIALKYQDGRALLYLYRPDMLARDLKDPLAREILSWCGYPEGSPAQLIVHLMLRLSVCPDFPHEIGLFLGYPAVDVRGFIQHKPCKCTGLWKVYESDEEAAKKHFQRCHNCTEAYVKRHQEGWTLSRLTIAPRQDADKATESERKVS